MAFQFVIPQESEPVMYHHWSGVPSSNRVPVMSAVQLPPFDRRAQLPFRPSLPTLPIYAQQQPRHQSPYVFHLEDLLSQRPMQFQHSTTTASDVKDNIQEKKIDKKYSEAKLQEHGQFKISLDVHGFQPCELFMQEMNGELCVIGYHEDQSGTRAMKLTHKLPPHISLSQLTGEVKDGILNLWMKEKVTTESDNQMLNGESQKVEKTNEQNHVVDLHAPGFLPSDFTVEKVDGGLIITGERHVGGNLQSMAMFFPSPTDVDISKKMCTKTDVGVRFVFPKLDKNAGKDKKEAMKSVRSKQENTHTEVKKAPRVGGYLASTQNGNLNDAEPEPVRIIQVQHEKPQENVKAEKPRSGKKAHSVPVENEENENVRYITVEVDEELQKKLKAEESAAKIRHKADAKLNKVAFERAAEPLVKQPRAKQHGDQPGTEQPEPAAERPVTQPSAQSCEDKPTAKVPDNGTITGDLSAEQSVQESSPEKSGDQSAEPENGAAAGVDAAPVPEGAVLIESAAQPVSEPSVKQNRDQSDTTQQADDPTRQVDKPDVPQEAKLADAAEHAHEHATAPVHESAAAQPVAAQDTAQNEDEATAQIDESTMPQLAKQSESEQHSGEATAQQVDKPVASQPVEQSDAVQHAAERALGEQSNSQQAEQPAATQQVDEPSETPKPDDAQEDIDQPFAKQPVDPFATLPAGPDSTTADPQADTEELCFVTRFEIPSADPDRLRLRAVDGRLALTQMREDGTERTTRRRLPDDVDIGRMTSTWRDGTLTVMAPYLRREASVPIVGPA